MTSYHMSPEEFRRHGHALVDRIARYMEEVESLPVLPDVSPGEIRALLPERAPEAPEPFDDVLADLDRVVLKGLAHWQSPNWFAFFPANSSPPAVLGELAAAGFAVQGMLWATSPAATEIESLVLDWLVDLLGLPERFKSAGPGGGVIQMSASDAVHTAMVVARIRAGGPAERMVAYASEQAHSSVEKGARVAGYGHFRTLPVDERYAVRPEALARAIEADLEAGLRPVFLVSTVGTTGTTAVDPLRALAGIARARGLWHHVDAAWAGSAMICPELRPYQDGVELVDSYTFNPHKWLFTNFDCSVFYVADRAPLLQALSILPPYLRNQASESGRVIDYRDWHLPLGRRFRALKLWFVLRAYGAEGLRHHVREHLRLASLLADRLDADPRFERVAPLTFALLCFRHVAGNEATEALAHALNATGRVHVSLSRIGEMAFLRVAIGQTRTEERHVLALWALLDELAAPG
jgi:aromatic-L-amino-acid decarboxylase